MIAHAPKSEAYVIGKKIWVRESTSGRVDADFGDARMITTQSPNCYRVEKDGRDFGTVELCIEDRVFVGWVAPRGRDGARRGPVFTSREEAVASALNRR